MATKSPDPRPLRVLAEAITVAGKPYPRGVVTTAIPPAVIRWLVEGTEYEWVTDPPAPPPASTKEAPDGSDR